MYCLYLLCPYQKVTFVGVFLCLKSNFSIIYLPFLFVRAGERQECYLYWNEQLFGDKMKLVPSFFPRFIHREKRGTREKTLQKKESVRFKVLKG
jgi:hypothetical protein